MSIPSFLGPLLPLQAISLGMEVSLLGGAAANTLNFSMETQEQDNWCWAATSVSVSHFFNSASTWTQCGVATACLGGSCCDQPMTCDVAYYLDEALKKTGNLNGAAIAGNESSSNVNAQIDQNRPVCCHITWSGGGGHFVAITGYDTANGDVDVADPYYGSLTLPYTSFVNNYRGSGVWDYTYLTM